MHYGNKYNFCKWKNDLVNYREMKLTFENLSVGEVIKLPIIGSNTMEIVVNDGGTNTAFDVDLTAKSANGVDYTVVNAGTVTISIEMSSTKNISYSNSSFPPSITTFGGSNSASRKGMFEKLTKVEISENDWLGGYDYDGTDIYDAWGLGPNVTSYQEAFKGATALTTLPEMSPYYQMGSPSNPEKGVTTMESMFEGCTSLVNVTSEYVISPGLYYETLLQASFWDVTWELGTRTVTSTKNMFKGCSALNCRILLNTSEVTTMEGMFEGCTMFNQTLVNFNTSNVKTMKNMFKDADAFNDGNLLGIGIWDTSAVTTFESMFESTNGNGNFQGRVNTFEVSSSATTTNMFAGQRRLIGQDFPQTVNVNATGNELTCANALTTGDALKGDILTPKDSVNGIKEYSIVDIDGLKLTVGYADSQVDATTGNQKNADLADKTNVQMKYVDYFKQGFTATPSSTLFGKVFFEKAAGGVLYYSNNDHLITTQLDPKPFPGLGTSTTPANLTGLIRYQLWSGGSAISDTNNDIKLPSDAYYSYAGILISDFLNGRDPSYQEDQSNPIYSRLQIASQKITQLDNAKNFNDSSPFKSSGASQYFNLDRPYNIGFNLRTGTERTFSSANNSRTNYPSYMSAGAAFFNRRNSIFQSTTIGTYGGPEHETRYPYLYDPRNNTKENNKKLITTLLEFIDLRDPTDLQRFANKRLVYWTNLDDLTNNVGDGEFSYFKLEYDRSLDSVYSTKRWVWKSYDLTSAGSGSTALTIDNIVTKSTTKLVYASDANFKPNDETFMLDEVYDEAYIHVSRKYYVPITKQSSLFSSGVTICPQVNQYTDAEATNLLFYTAWGTWFVGFYGQNAEFLSVVTAAGGNPANLTQALMLPAVKSYVHHLINRHVIVDPNDNTKYLIDDTKNLYSLATGANLSKTLQNYDYYNSNVNTSLKEPLGLTRLIAPVDFAPEFGIYNFFVPFCALDAQGAYSYKKLYPSDIQQLFSTWFADVGSLSSSMGPGSPTDIGGSDQTAEDNADTFFEILASVFAGLKANPQRKIPSLISQFNGIKLIYFERGYHNPTLNVGDKPYVSYIAFENGILNVYKKQSSSVTNNDDSLKSVYAFIKQVPLASSVEVAGPSDQSSSTQPRFVYSTVDQNNTQLKAMVDAWYTKANDGTTNALRDANLLYGPPKYWNLKTKNGVNSFAGLFEGKTGANTLHINPQYWMMNKVTDISNLTKNSTFNNPLETWVSQHPYVEEDENTTVQMTNMSSAFENNTAFNQPLNPTWVTSSVTNMEGMFKGATAFNQPLNAWNVGTVQGIFNNSSGNCNATSSGGFKDMFNGATSFNQPLLDWNIGSAVTLEGMFKGATSFNQDISKWKPLNVKSMASMFEGATAYTNDASVWSAANPNRGTNLLDTWGRQTETPLAHAADDTKKAQGISTVETFKSMFSGATNFDKRIVGWPVKSDACLTDMVKNSGLSTADSQGQGFNGLATPAVSLFNQSVCFNKGTKILCWKDEKEQYIAVEDLRNGTLVKTLDHGYKPIEMIKYSVSTLGRKVDMGMYKMKKEANMIDDLEMTGCHAVLVDEDEEYLGDLHEQEMIFKTPLDKQPIDGKLRLRSMFCSKFEKMPVDEYTVYSFALDKEQYQYGIWANGALVETTSHKMLNIMCGRNPNIKEVLSEEERV